MPRSVKAGSLQPQIVAVIASREDLARAARLRRLPDFFELRLDALQPVLAEVDDDITRLRAPLIITARHPFEGGLNNLSITRRRALLLRFLPAAALVDVELRSARQLVDALHTAKRLGVGRIISVHYLQRTPTVAQLENTRRAAAAWAPDIFKIASRTDNAEELARLLEFFEAAKGRTPISAMGIGALGRDSRRVLAARGSLLTYVHLGTAAAEGQSSLHQALRRRA